MRRILKTKEVFRWCLRTCHCGPDMGEQFLRKEGKAILLRGGGLPRHICCVPPMQHWRCGPVSSLLLEASHSAAELAGFSLQHFGTGQFSTAGSQGRSAPQVTRFKPGIVRRRWVKEQVSEPRDVLCRGGLYRGELEPACNPRQEHRQADLCESEAGQGYIALRCRAHTS